VQVVDTGRRPNENRSNLARHFQRRLAPLPVPDFRISMTYHDVGWDKLAAKTVDLTIDMAASAGVAVNNGGREPASWSHPTNFGSQRET